MNRLEHIKFGKFVAIHTYYQEMDRLGKPRNLWTDMLARKAANWIGKHIATLPDYIEPATNQAHRKIFHSQDAFNKIEKWKQNIRSNPNPHWQVDISLLMALSAYQSHILLDNTTPMGIPDYSWVWELLKAFKSRKKSNIILR